MPNLLGRTETFHNVREVYASQRITALLLPGFHLDGFCAGNSRLLHTLQSQNYKTFVPANDTPSMLIYSSASATDMLYIYSEIIRINPVPRPSNTQYLPK